MGPHTNGGQLRTSSHELQVTSTRGSVVNRHDLNEISDRPAFHDEIVICLQRFAQSW